MDAETRTRLRQRLEQLRRELMHEGSLAIPPARSDAVSQPDDDEAPLTEMNQSIASSRNRERGRRLAEINAALRRFAEDPESIGECENCGEDIATRRLELMPWVASCVACREAEEQERRVPGGRRKLTDFR